MNQRVEVINIDSRLQLSLISMYNSEYRVNGGIGFTVSAPSYKVLFYKSSEVSVEDNSKLNLLATTSLVKILKSTITKYQFSNAINIKIRGSVLPHHGFGTGTALRLACIEALFLANEEEYNKETLIKLSGRGGTSGIGIHSYFSGGFIFDLGHKKDTIEKLKPSHDIESTTLPLLLAQEDMPDWSIGICIPKDISPLSHKEERAFFDATCPLKKEAAYEASYHALFGTLAAVKTHDYDAFCLSIRNIQECDWKKAERDLHGRRLKFYEEQLYGAGADAVGMSSLGPALFFMAKDIDAVINKLKNLPCQLLNAKTINHGRVISDV